MRGGCGVERSKLMHQQGKCSLLTVSLQLDQGNYTLALFALSQVYLILKLHTCHISMVQLAHNPDAEVLYSEFCTFYCLQPGSSALSLDELGSYCQLTSRRSNCHLTPIRPKTNSSVVLR